ncbi:MAG: lysine--tRNA ligase, partial [Gammaproteobacteria bacterium]|nr:lysine--tRNA ligase [Gammaproteobacteria bacterium]
MSDDNDIVANRRNKLATLRERGNPFPNQFKRGDLAAALHERCADLDKAALQQDEPIEAVVAGRIMLKRVFGKASFITLQDVSGRIQCYVRRDEVGPDAYQDFKDLWDIGDIVGISGAMMRTDKGELTVQAASLELLTKTLRPLPEKYHGLSDKETRYRQRYLDLIMSEESRELFRMRSKVIAEIRRFFDARDYLEVETPMMHTIPGGATARPFITHHNSLDMDLYLRVAPELFLKRLVVGGFERVYEINRNFRNEGLSTRHNPEFTMLEFYQAYSTFEDLMELSEDLMRHVVQATRGTLKIEYQGQSVDFGKPVRRLTMAQSIVDHTDLTAETVADPQRLRAAAEGMNIPVEADWGYGKIVMGVFEARVEERLLEPTFITAYPAEVSPLARRNDDDADVTDRFELFIGGR